MSPHRLIPASTGHGHFATRRFDRLGSGGRLHMVSLAGAIEVSPHLPSTSYDMFMRATSAITRSAADVRATFHRMVFNILSSNRDNHTRQQAYLMTEGGDWRLAPALTSPTPPGQTASTTLMLKEKAEIRAAVTSCASARHGLSAKVVDEIIGSVSAALADWPAFVGAAGVTAASQREIAHAHDRFWAAFYPRLRWPHSKRHNPL
jgi:serine/threonine-protein kinase HipA